MKSLCRPIVIHTHTHHYSLFLGSPVFEEKSITSFVKNEQRSVYIVSAVHPF